MAVAPAIAQSPAAEPYVGPRPFERHERNLFHGRKTDANLLCDRVLSGRLTILYGQSGLGKSSLLRTRVIPLVEDHGARAVYFDNWSQSDPLRTLKETLAALAAESGVADASVGSPTLTELVRLISGANGLSLVLVLDQFEEFLVRNADRLDPLRGELATLVRSTAADVAVVLSLREEYLAALEPFRQKIGNLFESAYRLEELPENDLRNAILEPPKMFGGQCEEALADKLIADLRTGSASVAKDVRSSFVGLPMLQLVCRELWRQAGTGDKLLSVALYTRLGGAQRIIDDYVSGLMPRRARARSLTAGLLKQLAPRSGLKNPCSVEDFTDRHRKAEAIEAELKRLSRAGILRSRDYNTGVVYELQHDAFIRVLREWRDNVLERDRMRKRLLYVLAAAVVLTAVVYTWVTVRERQARMLAQEEQKREQQKLQSAQQVEGERGRTLALRHLLEGGFLDDLKKDDVLAPSRFDVVTSYLLWDASEKDDPGSLTKLKTTLMNYEGLLPANYGMRFAEPDKNRHASPLKIEYPKSRGLDAAQFLWVWRDYGQYIAGSFGYPVPMNVELAEAPAGLGAQELWLSAPNLPRIRVHAPTYDKQLVVRFAPSDVKDSRVRDFLEHYVSAPKFPSFDWAVIPRWSLPVWKAAKEKDHLGFAEVAIDASGLGAFHVLTNLANPDNRNKAIRNAFLTQRGVDALLHNASQRYPAAVEEAHAERGSCLAGDLGSLVEEDPYALLDLPLALDRLANERCEETTTSQPAPGRGQRAVGASQTTQAARAIQRDTRTPKFLLFKPRLASRIEPDPSFAAVEDYLPSADSRFQVYNGKIAGDEIERIRGELYRKYGVTLPDPVFPAADQQDSQPRDILSADLSGGPAAGIVRLGTELKRELWITPDYTRELEGKLSPNIRDWIRKQYALTSVKRLLQAVVARTTGPEGGIRYPNWLLSSLCFWAVAEGGDTDGSDMWNGEKIADDLRQTQLARVHPAAGEASTVRATVEAGIRQLAADRVDAAVTEFSAAVRQNSAQAREAFLGLWPQRLPEVWVASVRSRFEHLNKIELGTGDRIDLEDLPVDGLPDTQASRELALFRLAARVEGANRSGRLQNLLDHAAPFEQWPLPQARWLGVEFLKQWDPSVPKTGSQQQFNAAVALLRRVVEKAEEQQDARDTFRDVVDLSVSVPGKPGQYRDAPKWSWQVLEELMAVRPGGAALNLQLELSFLLMSEDLPERLNRSLALTANYQKILSQSDLKADERGQQEDLLTYARAQADWRLGEQGNAQSLAEAATLFRKVLASKWIQTERKDLAQLSYEGLISNLYSQGRATEAHALWEDARKKRWPNDFSEEMAAVDSAELFGQLAAGNSAGAGQMVKFAADVAARHSKDGSDSQFQAALGSIVTQTGDWRGVANRFLSKNPDHQFRDYVMMILYAFDGGPKSAGASRLLAERGSEISRNKGTWPARLKEGDTTAWHEMVMSRFMGAPETASLLDIVTSEERWKQSGLVDLPMSRKGLECEVWFYEAMRAKANGDIPRVRTCLDRCIAVRFESYLEDHMARFIRATMK